MLVQPSAAKARWPAPYSPPPRRAGTALRGRSAPRPMPRRPTPRPPPRRRRARGAGRRRASLLRVPADEVARALPRVDGCLGELGVLAVEEAVGRARVDFRLVAHPRL